VDGEERIKPRDFPRHAGGRADRLRATACPDVNAFPDEPELSRLCGLRDGRRLASGVRPITEFGRMQRCAIMCAEAVWWRCHRHIIADYLLSQGETVFHILEPNHMVGAQLTPAAKRGADGALTDSGRS
jgi:Domain of unknown function DUF488